MKEINTELTMTTAEPMPVAAMASQGISIEAAFNAAASKALDKDSLQVMKELLAMDAARQFNTAFVALQQDMPTIVAKTVIPNRGKYEKFEDLMLVVGPLLTKHGFTVSFSQDFKENRILETCTLSHCGGHSRSNSFAVRSGGKADSETQSDCKASTTAKRNAFCNALNIVIRQDCLNEENDAGIEGDPSAIITHEQAESLKFRVYDTGSNEAAFLQFARAKSFFEIPASRYNELDFYLRRTEAKPK